MYRCAYCANSADKDIPRASFSPRELTDLTLAFYRRNYIEGLFLSSAVQVSPDHTMGQMIQTLKLLRNEGFGGYIHMKTIPGASQELIDKAGRLADRLSVNIELPSRDSLGMLAPDKSVDSILQPMRSIAQGISKHNMESKTLKHAPSFSPGGQSTQMIVGASPETDRQILQLSQALYRKFTLKRIYYSAYIPLNKHPLLPLDTRPPLLREHRLYQADWLMRFYGFDADELLDPSMPMMDEYLDPKCGWAMRHPEFFPVEVTKAPLNTLLRVPGIGLRSAGRIIEARRFGGLKIDDLRKLGVVMKRAAFFVTCRGAFSPRIRLTPQAMHAALAGGSRMNMGNGSLQLSIFPEENRLITQPQPLALPTFASKAG